MHTKLTIYFNLFFTVAFGQNLVPNPDFEVTDGTFCGIPASGDYTTFLQDWYSPTTSSPDVFFTTNAPSCWNNQPNSTYSGPIGLKGPQLPRSGSVMSGLFLYTIPGLEQRDYIQVPLDNSLIVGERYLVECYVSLADSTEYGSNSLGMYLSTDAVSLQSGNVLNYTPQVISANYLMNTTDWVRLFDTLIPTEAYSYLTIGNFSSDAQTTLSSNPGYSGRPGTYGAYYYIDDVRVERVSKGSTVGLNELQPADKKLIRIVDLLGRATTFQPNTVLIYEYEDGSTERKILLEP